MKLTQRIKSWFGGAQEGSWRGPFFGVGELGDAFSMGPLEDGWQRHLHVGSSADKVAAVYSIVMLYARAVSQCEAKHQRLNDQGGYDTVTTSPASRVLYRPNDYETWPQIILNTVSEMLFRGESLWVATRDDRFQVTAVHRIARGGWSVHVDPTTRAVFYGLGDHSNPLTPTLESLAPSRDVAHFRMHTPRHPLMGESPVSAAAMAVGINVALNHSQLAFFSRMNRPSGVLSTDVNLTVAQIKQLREAFDNQSKQMNSGGIPILGSGLKFSPMGIAQNDAQLIEQQRLSFVDICRVYGVPAPLLPETAGGTVGGTEAMINHWLSIGLGSMLTSIEQTIARLFDLRPDSRIHFDPAPLLRVDFVGRIEGLVKAVQGGLMTPDEARSTEGRQRIEGGGEGYMQQQMVPLTLLNAMHQATISAKQPQSPPQPIEASLAVARDAIAKAMHHE